MARKSEPSTRPAGPELPLTQRAYTLRLRGIDPKDNAWRDALWATHEAINRGAKEFGDWLLTLRGGLSHELAEPPPAKGKVRTAEETAALRKSRRILLALSWLSVEDERGAPSGALRIATGRDTDSERREKVLSALRSVLTTRRIEIQDAKSWEKDCAESLSAKIREDAVWVNRSTAFDAAMNDIGPSLTREEAWDLLRPFFGSRDSYMAQTEIADEESGHEEEAKDLVQKAGQWLSSRFGTGSGANFKAMADVYAAMAEWANSAEPFASGATALFDMAKALAQFTPTSADADGILSLISGPGYKSATRNIVKSWSSRAGSVSKDDLSKFVDVTTEDEAKCKGNVGGKGRRPWSDRVLQVVENECGFTYLQTNGPARHSEFAVMLDHAARRVSIGHSWIKRAEAERRRFEEDAKRLAKVPLEAVAWLDKFVAERSDTSGATAAGSEYRIRRRAIEGWEEIVKKWKRASCGTEDDRIAAAREAQADPEIDKFGDIQLFEALAQDDAECVWRIDGKADPNLLRDYVLGHDAKDRQRRFKVPAYRHPDPLRHPVFGDFGNSRWSIEYAVHEAAKVAGAKRRASAADAAWLKDPYGLRMGLWDGSAVHDLDLRWSSKRLAKDLALSTTAYPDDAQSVTRADRLGRAASGLRAGETPCAAGLFELADWNGRLQAPRAQLDSIADRVAKHGWDFTAKAMRDRIEWLVSFSAKLECRGPFFDYAARFEEVAPAKPFVSRKGELAVKHQGNDARQGHAKLILSRLPEVRILAVDLGHRFAASCALWETVSIPAYKKEIADRVMTAGGAECDDLYVHKRHTDQKSGKVRTTIYRRIGADKLADGTDHPAPWARLDRQFLIKLQGEDRPARKCSSAELQEVESIEKALGRVRDQSTPLPLGVDELMAEAVRTQRLALRRLGDAARIAYAFKSDAVRQTPGGGSQPHTPDSRQGAILDALMRWSDLAHGDRWKDEWAATAWKQEIKCDVPALAEDADRWDRKRHRAMTKELVAPIAAELTRSGAQHLHTLWSDRWNAEDEAWRPRLKWLRNWILPRGLRSRQGETPAKAATRKVLRGAARNVGGLSLTRIATIRELYQIQKAYAMRPEPDDPRRNIAAKGDDRFDEFGRSVLQVMERMREQRVKQIASRIVEAALGVGRYKPATGKQRDRKRPQVQTDPPCHAVVIENLRNYRPDELQTRRENRALMSWSSGKVRKYLEEGCQLHGLHLREVQPNYTSRQCSRTGLPGMRCVDVPVREFLASRYWTKVVKAANKRMENGGTDSLDRLLVDLHTKWSKETDSERIKQSTLRVPKEGGDLFVAATEPGSECRTVQADLNAAANIGLRALLDPDFSGKWWYVPCDSSTGMPAKDKCGGSAYIRLEQRLIAQQSKDSKEKSRDKTNAWRDVGADGGWRVHAPYWNDVKSRVVRQLTTFNGVDCESRPR